MPKVSMLAVISVRRSATGSAANAALRMKYQMVRSSRPRPTTVKPMTVPASKATRRPELRLLEAALAVRQLAMVAVRMPTKPARPEKNAPVRKANGVNQESMPANAMQIIAAKTTARKIATPAYWRLRYALAPSLTHLEILAISGVPSGALCTLLNFKNENTRAIIEPMPVKMNAIDSICNPLTLLPALAMPEKQTAHGSLPHIANETLAYEKCKKGERPINQPF